MNHGQIKICKEVVATYFKVLSGQSSEDSEEKHGNAVRGVDKVTEIQSKVVPLHQLARRESDFKFYTILTITEASLLQTASVLHI